MVLRRIKDRLQKFNVAVAEVEHQDLWQRAGSASSPSRPPPMHVEQQLAAAADEIDRVEPGLICAVRASSSSHNGARPPSRPRRRSDSPGTERHAQPRGRPRSRHRLHHAHAGQGVAGPAAGARLLHDAGRRDGATRDGARRSSGPRRSSAGRSAAGCSCDACRSSSSGSTNRSRTRTGSSRSCATCTRKKRSAPPTPRRGEAGTEDTDRRMTHTTTD